MEDLAQYGYALFKDGAPFTLPEARAVGWLSRHREYPRGEVDDDAVSKLFWLATHERVRQSRGLGYCDLCGVGHHRRCVFRRSGKELVVGDAEVWIPDGDDAFFAAPTIILHYIVGHEYRPPEPFVRAVLALDLSTAVQLDSRRKEIFAKHGVR